ncbi:MAG: hypothetical protein Q8O37_17505 [Sulfuricellaceae bacterium]|nr:hypothetical protein [Sulfuricellaceae bacterium]
MGGFGSGRRDQGGKGTTSDCRKLDVRLFQRDGLLVAGCSFTYSWVRNDETEAAIQVRTEVDHVVLDYRHQRGGGEWKSENYPVLIEWTSCNLGGKRAWFLCPACGRRVAILYSGAIFTCRHCNQMAYDCQRENAVDRARRQADAIRRRLGWCAGIAYPPGDKPHGMHWRTYGRLMRRYNDFIGVAVAGMAEQFGRMNRRLGGL